MSTKIDRVDFNTITFDESYTPYVGLEYELGEGVVGTMRAPVEQLVEDYEALLDRDDFDSDKDQTYAIVDLVLDFEDDVDLSEQRAECLYPVVDRASEDFFFLSKPKKSERMKSFMEEITQLRKLSNAQATEPNGREEVESTTPSKSG